jgi:hypothetical protein
MYEPAQCDDPAKWLLNGGMQAAVRASDRVAEPPEEQPAMPEPQSKGEQPDPPVENDIEKLARSLREAEHLEPEARVQAADLLGDLAAELDQTEPSAHNERLAESAAQLVRAVKDQREPALIGAARERVEKAVAAAEAKAPVATDLVLQLIDVLAGLGI